jgi:hypothetical protein
MVLIGWSIEAAAAVPWDASALASAKMAKRKGCMVFSPAKWLRSRTNKPSPSHLVAETLLND